MHYKLLHINLKYCFLTQFLTIFKVKNILFQNIKILRGPLLAYQLPKSVAVAQGPAYANWCKIPGKT